MRYKILYYRSQPSVTYIHFSFISVFHCFRTFGRSRSRSRRRWSPWRSHPNLQGGRVPGKEEQASSCRPTRPRCPQAMLVHPRRHHRLRWRLWSKIHWDWSLREEPSLCSTRSGEFSFEPVVFCQNTGSVYSSGSQPLLRGPQVFPKIQILG